MSSKPPYIQSGRMVYVEPNSLSSQDSGVVLNGNTADNIIWKPEDLNINVDLQAVLPRRYDCGEVDYNIIIDSENGSRRIFKGFMEGSKLDINSKDIRTSEKYNLTTDYTDISYVEIKNGKRLTSEFVGIRSINISFSNQYHPVVNIKFVDVRGYSIMGPESFDYDREENDLEFSGFRNFYKSLFNFPYPRFLLTVKGLFGTKITLTLSIKDFKSSLNAQTGDYELDVSFIGYMYGLYSDLPFNYLMIAPYISVNGGSNAEIMARNDATKIENGSTANEDGNPDNTNVEYGDNFDYSHYTCDYWNKRKSEGVFVYDNGNPIYTFLEYVTNYSKLSEKLSEDVLTDNGQNEIARMRDYMNAAEEAKALLGGIKSYKNNFTEQGCSINVIEDGKSYFFARENNGTRFFDDTSDDEFDSQINAHIRNINKILGESHRLSMKELKRAYGEEYGKSKIVDSNGIILNNRQYKETLKNAYNGTDGVIWQDVVDVENKAKEVVNGNDSLKDVDEKAAQKLKEKVAEALGFTPNIQNYYRMLFAHLDCFMTLYYEVLGNVRSSNRKVSDFSEVGVVSDMTDLPKNIKDGDEYFVPPYPATYQKTEQGRRAVYPTEATANINGLRGIMPELAFVDGIINGALAVTGEVNKIREILDNKAKSIDRKATFIPIQWNDVFFLEKNPYTSAIDNYDKYGLGGILYTFVIRYLSAKLTAYNAYGISIDSDIPLNEALNFLLATSGYITSELGKQLQDLDSKEKIIELLSPFTAQTKTVVNYLNIVGDKIYFGKDNSVEPFGSYDSSLNPTLFTGDYFTNPTYDDVLHWITPVTKEQYKANEAQYENNSRASITVLDKADFDALSTDITVYDRNGDKVEYNCPIKPIGSVSELIDYGYYDIPSNYTDRLYLKDEEGKYNNQEGYRKLLLTNAFSDLTFIRHKAVSGGTLINKVVEQLIKQKTDNQYGQALYYIASLPFSRDALSRTLNDLVYAFDKNISGKIYDGSFVKELPKPAILFFGGLLYRREEIQNGKGDICKLLKDKNNTECGDYSIRLKKFKFKDNNNKYSIDSIIDFGYKEEFKSDDFEKFKIDTQEINVKYIAENVDYVRIQFLIDYFKVWAETEFPRIYNELKMDDGGYNESLSNVTKDFYLSTERMMVNNCSTSLYYTLEGEHIRKPHIFNVDLDIDTVFGFVNKIKEVFRKDGPDEETYESEEASEEDISTAMKYEVYYTLKNLYDKWLCGYTVKSFQLNHPSVETEERKKRFTNGVKNIGDLSTNEYSNFIFVDSYFNDIGADFLLSPEIVNNIVMDTANGNSRINTYNIFSEFAVRNGMLFTVLPVYTNFYDGKTLCDIFKPNPTYNNLNGRGYTYVCMYTNEPSSIGGDTNTEYKTDALDLSGTWSNPEEVGEKYFKTNTDENKLSITVPVFDVTYARQNQGYFKNISIGMDSPKVTDYSVKNMLAISQGSANGDVATPFTLGQDIFSVYSNFSYKCRVEMMGCMNIMPMMYFQLNNIPMFKGAYMISSVSHNITPGNMTTSFEGIKISKRIYPYNQNIFTLQRMIKQLGLKDRLLNIDYEYNESSEYSSENRIGNTATYGGNNVKYGKESTVGGWVDAVITTNLNGNDITFDVDKGFKTLVEKWGYNGPFINNQTKFGSYRLVTTRLNCYHGKCTGGPKRVIEAGTDGKLIITGMKRGEQTLFGKYISGSLVNNGFNPIYCGRARHKNSTEITPNGKTIKYTDSGAINNDIPSGFLQAGDVCVMDGGNSVGHACIWSGTRWASDTWQNSMTCYSGADGNFVVYRLGYKGPVTDLTAGKGNPFRGSKNYIWT